MTGGDGGKTNTDDEVLRLRSQIDDIDSELLTLLNLRAATAIRIGRLKRIRGDASRDPKREADIVRALLAKNKGPVSADQVLELWHVILMHSRDLQAADRT